MKSMPTTSTLFRLGARAGAVTGVYLVAALTVLATVIWLRRAIAPEALRGFLGLVVFATLTSGLEPATAKADALRGGAATDLRSILAVSALKALIASPLLALVWRYGDPDLGWTALAWTPAMTVAGFCATDARVRLDLTGRHTLAVGLKQGSLAGGLVLAGALLALGWSLPWAIGLSTLVRLTLVGVLLLVERPTGGTPPAGDTRKLWSDRRWFDMAAVSVIAAVSGSADRVFGLRFLPAAAYGAYYVAYEVISKFWLIPYVLTPILFARQASGADNRRFSRVAWGLTALAGAAFLAALTTMALIWPSLAIPLTGAPLDGPTCAFALAIVLGAFTQLRIAELQGQGASRRALVVSLLSAAMAMAAFYVGASRFGLTGLFLAWPLKAAFELALALMPATASPEAALADDSAVS